MRRQQRGLGTSVLLPLIMLVLLLPGPASGAGERFLGVQVGAYQQGIVIVGVVQGSPATRVVDTTTGQAMSLEPGDIIQSLNNFYVLSPEHFGQLLRTGPPVATMTIWDVRNNVLRVVVAGVGPPDEIAAYLNQGPGTPPPTQPTTPTQEMSAAQRRARIQALDVQIKSLEWKIRDQERSLRMLEESGEKNPGATNLMAQQSALNLLQAYEQQKAQLEMEKSRLESGM